MAQPSPGAPSGPSQRRPAGGSRSSRRVVAPVKPSFPWGFAAGSALLALVLVAVLGYAIYHKGSGFQTAAGQLDKTFTGIQVTDNQSANHVATRVAYPQEATQAPDGGNHNPVWQTCAVYTSPIVQEHAVHSLEHGSVWVTYNPSLPAAQVATLAALVTGNDHRMLSPYPGQSSPVALQAWGRRLDVPTAGDARVKKFLDGYTNGPQTREVGGSCSGGVDQPGTVPYVQAADGSFVPGTDQSTVPAEGTVPSGEPGSAAPGSVPSPVPSSAPSP